MRVFRLRATDSHNPGKDDRLVEVIANTPGEAQAHAERCGYAVRSIDANPSDSTSDEASDVLWATDPIVCPSCGWALEGQPITDGMITCASCTTPVRLISFEDQVRGPGSPLRLPGTAGDDGPAPSAGRAAAMGAIACGLIGLVVIPVVLIGILLAWHAMRASGGQRGIPGLAASLAAGAVGLIRLIPGL